MTGFFETSVGFPECFGVTSGNHDGAGLSHGVLQFNFGTGSLQPIWIYLINTINSTCRTIFGADYAEWENVVLNFTTGEQVLWADSITDRNRNADGYKLILKWENYFAALGTTQASIDKQIPYSENSAI